LRREAQFERVAAEIEAAGGDGSNNAAEQVAQAPPKDEPDEPPEEIEAERVADLQTMGAAS
jgi:hypothetical protein